VGRERPHNEDTFLAEPPLYAVADGLGGHQAGEIASRVAVDSLAEDAPASNDAAALGRAVERANDAVLDAADQGLGREGMGTTLTAAVVRGTRITLGHVGDSRAYLLHEGTLSRITEDHSVVADMIRGGTLTEEEARVHPSRSVITRALGSDEDMRADTRDIVAQAGDVLLLATDGLHGMLTDAEIGEVLDSASDPTSAAKALIAAANKAGGSDNITVVVVEIDESDTAAHEVSRSRRGAAAMLWVVAIVAALTVGIFGVYTYARSSAYVIAEDGVVVVYRGLPGTLGGLGLSWLEQETDVEVSTLPAVTAERLEQGVHARDLPTAMELIAEYRLQAAEETTGVEP
jgi:protein phosphatase